MKLIFTLYSILFVSLHILLCNCSSLPSQRALFKTDSRPLWVKNHPYSKTHFIGIGSSEIQKDLHQAHQRARNRALNDIAQQISVTILSETKIHENVKSVGNESKSLNSFNEKIVTFTKATISKWEEIRTWHSPKGFYWSKIILNKKKYYAEVNKKITQATQSVCDIIRHSKFGSIIFRLNNLNRGLQILDSFPHLEMSGIINNREVILRNELGRMISQMIENIVIIPNKNHITIPSSKISPCTLGVEVFYLNQKDNSYPIQWTSSNKNVSFQPLYTQSYINYQTSLSSLPPSNKVITITATLDFGNLTYDLIRKNFTIPNCAITIIREKIPVFIEDRNSFSKSLAVKLANRSSIIIVNSRNKAKYLLKSKYFNSPNTILQNSLYIAKANLLLTLLKNSGETVIDFNKPLCVADGISAIRAIENTQKYALNLAIKEVEKVL